RDAAGNVMHATMVEKLLVLLLAKLTNLVPEGGIWMNTQRPEWNDANNALAGKGLSVVTAAYLRRFLAFWKERLASSEPESYAVNEAVVRLFNQVQRTFVAYQDHLDSGFSDQARRAIMDELGMAAAAYRTALYEKGLTPAKRQISSRQLYDFLTLSLDYIEQTLYANWRQDGLAHSYNTLHISDREAAVEKLYLMLEGQVAFLSSGILEPEEGLALLQKLRQSDLYRGDLHTYMLYPNRTLPGFFQKNNISAAQLAGSALAAALIEAGDSRLLIRDEDGVYHFNGAFHNAGDVGAALDDLAEEAPYTDLVETDRVFILKLFESTFSHREFTGRSGTFFAYEGLGSVYWHMVSKLLLAAQESYQQAVDQEADPTLTARLAKVYYDIRRGLGFNKSPAEYGAFPADPYSHTPMGGGARQPGMTGQVKEEILTRFGELGVSIRRGALSFKPTLLKEEEYLPEVSSFTFVDTTSKAANISLPPNSLAFTICQTPVIYVLAESSKIDVLFKDGRTETISGCSLDTVTSQHIFDRDGQIEMLWVSVES
ncbi:MAG: hypothetical protein ACK2T3_17255, partial [Candidatus Promineifilaceae bacterium]